MTGQTVGALVIAVVAAAWLVRRFWRRGFDDEAHGCSGCSVDTERPKVTGLSRGPSPHERPQKSDSSPGALRRP